MSTRDAHAQLSPTRVEEAIQRNKAEGAKLYLDGVLMQTDIKVDNLVRSIIGYGPDKINWGYGDSKFRIGYKLEYAMRGIVVDELKVFDKKLTALEVEKIQGKKIPSVTSLIPNPRTEPLNSWLSCWIII